MCLEVLAVPAAAERVSAERLERVSGLCVRKRRGVFHFSRDGGCSCSLMAEKADWGDAAWSLDSSVLAGLAAALRLLHEEANGVSFLARWIGEPVEAEQRIPVKELLADVLANRVRNKCLYLTGHATGLAVGRR